MSLYEFAFLWEGQNEMEKQGWLQDSGGDISPINGPIEIVQLTRVFE
jgi:hypothetical protein